jgi:cytosine permease
MWVPFFDRLGTVLAGPTSIGWLAASVVLAAMACYFLLYDIPALWGWRAGHRVSVIGASTFGTLGSEWIIGVATGLAAVVFYAVSVSSALRLTFLGLISCGLIEDSALQPRSFGPLVVESPVFLLTALFWIYIICMSSLLQLTGVVVALMQVYTPAALLLLGATALLTSPGLSSLADARSSLPSLVASARPDVGVGAPQAVQLIFGYFAVSGLIAVEWGMAVRDRRDVRIGGWISVILAGSYCALMAVLTVAGALGKPGTELIDKQSFLLASPLTFHWAVFRGIGGMTGGVILLLFGLATLPAACYAAWMFARRLSDHWPRIGRSSWTWIEGAAAFLLTAVSWTNRLEVLFSLMGAIFAPAVGALVADAWRQKGEWKGIRQGFHWVGLIAWAVGVVIGLVPLFASMIGWPTAQQFQPAAVFAFLSSAGVYTVLAALGPEQPWLPLPDMEGHETDEPVTMFSEKEAAASVQSS